MLTLYVSFNRCRERITSATLLHHPHVGDLLGLFTDASGVAVGACLQQFVDSVRATLGILFKEILDA